LRSSAASSYETGSFADCGTAGYQIITIKEPFVESPNRFLRVGSVNHRLIMPTGRGPVGLSIAVIRLVAAVR
jgi:hypothetical protein